MNSFFQNHEKAENSVNKTSKSRQGDCPLLASTYGFRIMGKVTKKNLTSKKKLSFEKESCSIRRILYWRFVDLTVSYLGITRNQFFTFIKAAMPIVANELGRQASLNPLSRADNLLKWKSGFLFFPWWVSKIG